MSGQRRKRHAGHGGGKVRCARCSRLVSARRASPIGFGFVCHWCTGLGPGIPRRRRVVLQAITVERQLPNGGHMRMAIGEIEISAESTRRSEEC